MYTAEEMQNRLPRYPEDAVVDFLLGLMVVLECFSQLWRPVFVVVGTEVSCGVSGFMCVYAFVCVCVWICT
jgi:hypothetical protein